MPSNSQALPASSPEINLFSDASFQYLIETGAWAFSVPALGLEGAGFGDGPSTEYFEIRAALAAINSVLEIDHTYRPLRVNNDSELAIQLLQHAAKSEPLPTRKSFVVSGLCMTWRLSLPNSAGSFP